jgi:hypothetical protein
MAELRAASTVTGDGDDLLITFSGGHRLRLEDTTLAELEASRVEFF